MNTPNGSDSREPEDQDISALFDAQDVSPSAELDNTILAYARQAISPDRPQNDSTAIPNIQEQGQRQGQGKILRTGRFSAVQRRNRWLSIAATVVVVAGVAPFLLQSPESELSRSSIEPTASSSLRDEALLPESIQTAPLVLEQTENSASLQADLSVQQSASAVSGLSENLAAREQQSAKRRSEQEQTILAAPTPLAEESMSESVKSFGGNAGDMAESREDVETTAALITADSDVVTEQAKPKLEKPAYRKKPEIWLQEIRRLQELKKQTLVEKEFRLFRETFPDFKTDFSITPSNTK